MSKPDYTGYFNYGSQDNPNYGSIGGALGTSHVQRHFEPGFIVIWDHRGGFRKVSAVSAVAEGVIDQTAADAIAAQDRCFGNQSNVGSVVFYSAKERGPAYKGTAAEPVITALLALLADRSSVPNAEALAAALEAFKVAPAAQ